MKKLKIVNKNKFKRSICFILLVIIMILFITLSSYSNTKTKYKIDFVSKGDTLWSITEKEINNNDYYKGKDIRKVIYEIKELNSLSNNNLVEGTSLKIPTY